ncbi:MAG: alpha/beta fold hydrolase [Candidatus Eremiobacteraeota bacterium]|nr:alpha/beta fold hydrolase [Candidatus Eremiobacteraeota bacterium]
MPIEEFSYGLDMSGGDPAALNDALRAVTLDVMSDPLRMGMLVNSLMLSQQGVAMNTLRRMQGDNPAPIASAGAGDKRFSDPAWTSNPFLMSMLEEYLVRRQYAQQLVEQSRLPDATKRKARFAMTMMMDSLAPSNLPWLNPTVIKEAINSGGSSLMNGMVEFLDDVKNNGGYPKQVDTSSFVLGENMAATKGEIVFRNELIELIAYYPQTDTVHERPLLMSPPWINKFYIMDIAPGRSFVEWAVAHGHQTFMMSYRNPDASMRDYTMDTYLEKGPLAALDAVQRLTGAPQVNIAALCLGGTMSVALLAYLAAKGEAHRVGALTTTNTIVDFAEPGDLGVFTDEASIAKLEKKMAERGFLESDEMAGTFNWMRANDLIWSYVVSNWYMGKKPPAFDILAWNGDSTRMPAAMHSQYLRACYLHNLLVVPNAFVLNGVPIDLGRVETPMYVLGAEADHIAPWRTTYMTSQYVRGNVKYTRTNSGHVAGICNPPGNPKACYWTNDRVEPGESPDAWLDRAVKRSGSWWEDWAEWADAHGGERRAPYTLPHGGEPAPGRYVRNETAEPLDLTEPVTAHE